MMLRRIDGACDSLLFVHHHGTKTPRLARLLRTRHEGTRPCTANTVRNWSRLIEPSLGAQDHGSTIAGRGCAPQQKRPAHVRFGCLAMFALPVRPEGANHQWRKIPPGKLSIGPVADERLGRVTGKGR